MNTLEIIEQIKIGWRALGFVPDGKELSSIAVVGGHSIKIRAGRLSDNNEIILFRFKLIHFPNNSSMPSANGFNVRVYEIDNEIFIGVNRTSIGPFDLFEAMLVDIINQIMFTDTLPHSLLFKRFMDRIHAWQEFMGRGKGGLSKKNELGLIGELLLLREILNMNIPAVDVLCWWKGPLHGIHDFQISGSAIEVKTSSAARGFQVEVFDIEQLDPIGLDCLIVAAVRINHSNKGVSLPEIIESIKVDLNGNPAALNIFETAIAYAGYSKDHDNHYTIKASVDSIRYFEVNDKFPSLRRKNIPVEVCKIKYAIDLDDISTNGISLEDALEKIGVISNGAQ